MSKLRTKMIEEAKKNNCDLDYIKYLSNLSKCPYKELVKRDYSTRLYLGN